MHTDTAKQIAELAQRIKTANAASKTAEVDRLADEIIRIAASPPAPEKRLKFVKLIPPGTT